MLLLSHTFDLSQVWHEITSFNVINNFNPKIGISLRFLTKLDRSKTKKPIVIKETLYPKYLENCTKFNRT